MNGKIQLGFILFISFLFLLACSPNEGDTIEKYYEDDDDSAGEDDDSGVDDDDVADDDDNDTADDDDSVPEEIPEVPTELRAIESGSNTINLSWTDNSDDEDGFWVYRQEEGTKGFTAIAQTGPDVPFYFDDSAACETQYDYYVTAFNMAGESAGSNEAAATAGYCEVAAPTDLAAMTISQTQVDLAWSDNSFNETNFQIQRKESGSDVWVNIGDAEANVTEFSDLDGVCGTDYEYRVQAYNQHSFSPWSNNAQTLTQDCPLIRPQPVLTDISPNSYVAFSRDYLEEPPDPLYPLEITGEGIASDTKVMVDNFILPCDTGGEGISCEADDNGDPVADTCATTCIASLPDYIMRNADTYVIKLYTPAPVFGGDGASSEHAMFNVVAPLPEIERIWPRGILQLTNLDGTPIAHEISFRFWAKNIMDNCQVRLENNYGQAIFAETDETTGEQVGRVTVSSANIAPANEPYDLVFINPSPGGGETRVPFGINPRVEGWNGSGMLGFPATSASNRMPRVSSSIAAPMQMHTNTGLAWHGTADTTALRDQKGRLVARFSKQSSLGTLPFVVGSQIDFETTQHFRSTVTSSNPEALYHGGDGSFGDGDKYPGASGHCAIGDLNGDGILDLVSPKTEAPSLLIQLGNGDGSFSESTELDMEEACPTSVAIGDLNGDGIPDMVTANMNYPFCPEEGISILLGDGSGEFNSRTHLEMGDEPRDVLISDISSDGIPDIITANSNSDDVSVRLGKGDGSFENKTDYEMGEDPDSMAMEDLDGDGALDIVTANISDGTLSIRPGDGLGNFGEKIDLAMGTSPYSITIGDMNGDGAPDLVAAGSDNSSVLIRFGDGNGSFEEPMDIDFEHDPFSVDIADLNGDGALDLVVGTAGPISFRLGDGDGAFGDEEQIYSLVFVYWLMVCDLSNDGIPDIVAHNPIEAIWVGLGQGGGSYPDKIDIDNYSSFFILKDVNNDNFADLISTYNGVAIQIGDGQGGFGEKTIYTMGTGTHRVVVEDIDKDGRLDIASTNYSSDDVSIRFGDGAGGFGDNTDYPMGDGPGSLAISDLNGDGLPDMVVANTISGDISLRLATGYGVFGDKTDFTMGNSPGSLSLEDLNGDNAPDVVTLNNSEEIAIRMGDGNGGFGDIITFEMGGVPVSIAVADISGDSVPDIVTANYLGRDVSIFLGNGDGSFGAKVDLPMADWPNSLALDDINGDGALDIVTANVGELLPEPPPTPGSISIRVGDGAGNFSEEINLEMGLWPKFVALGDLDGDQVLDIVTANDNWDTFNMSVRLMGKIPGTWHQELTDSFSDDPDQPWLQKFATTGATTEVTIHQGHQTVSKVGARVLLEWSEEPAGSVTLTLHSPNEENDPIELGTFTAFDQWPCHLYEGDDDDECEVQSWRLNKTFRETALGSDPAIPELVDWHGVQPTGYWRLEIDNQTGADAEVKNWTVITDGHF